MDSYKKARLLVQLKQKYHLQVTTLAKKTGLSEATIYKYFKVWREASDDTLTKWKNGNISFRTAYRRVKTQNTTPEPKPDFFTGKPVQEWNTIRVSNDTREQLETFRENIQKITEQQPITDIKQAFFNEQDNIQKIMEEKFGDPGTKLTQTLHTIMKKRNTTE